MAGLLLGVIGASLLYHAGAPLAARPLVCTVIVGTGVFALTRAGLAPPDHADTERQLQPRTRTRRRRIHLARIHREPWMSASEHLNAVLAGRYAIEREVGAGGMATAYLAKDLRHRRNVALKVLGPELAAELGAERFLREILYYVMPFVEGESLGDRPIRRSRSPAAGWSQGSRAPANLNVS